jgi:Ca2+-binding EF-hand superfamily protein
VPKARIIFCCPAQEQNAHYNELKRILKSCDEDRSGNLNAHELGKCITAYNDARHPVYSNEGHWTGGPVTPTEEEVNLILQAAGKHTKNAVDFSEIEFALDLWHSYLINKPEIEAIFAKYDTDHNEQLEFDQLARFLTDLNEGHAPKVTQPDSCPVLQQLLFLKSRKEPVGKQE